MRSLRFRGALFAVVIFAAGVLLGVALERQLARSRAPAEFDVAEIMRTFDRELGLDATQHARIERLLLRRQAVVDSTWHATRARLTASMDSTEVELDSLLSPEQRVRLRKVAASRR